MPANVTMREQAPGAPSGASPHVATPLKPSANTLPPGWRELKVTKRDGGIITLVVSEDLTPIEEMEMSVGLPTEKMVNPVWMQWARLAATVRRIDGDPVGVPSTESEVKVIMTRCGTEGMRAVERGWSARYANAIAEIKARAKNL